MVKGVVRSRRVLVMTAEQDRRLREEAAARGVPEHVVLREVIDAGFSARGNGGAGGEAVLDALGRLSERVEGLERTVRACGKASAAQASWSAFAELDLLRRIMDGVGLDPDGEEVASRAMARFLCEADCNVPTRIWESAGRRMVAGAGYNEALRGACRENGVPWPNFSGQPEGGRVQAREGPARGPGRGAAAQPKLDRVPLTGSLRAQPAGSIAAVRAKPHAG